MAVTLKPLSSQVVVITGASSGIGLATAERLHGDGASVFLVARNEAALAAIVARLGEGRAAHLAHDVGVSGWAAEVVAAATARFGRIDGWVNNAAAALYARLDETTEAEHRRVFDVGYFGLVEGSLAAVEALTATGGGALINTGSALSERAIPIQGAYSSMKHAVRAFTDVLRMETAMADKPVSVTLIKPNATNTPYPEHARNKMGTPARLPPMLYDPRLVAKAIAHALEHPTRELMVGGEGIFVSKLSNIVPGLTDRVMELVAKPLQQTDEAPPPERVDNLFEPRSDGAIDSEQDVFTRTSSLYLEAQLHPARTVALGLGAVALAGLMARFGTGRRFEG